MYNELTSKTESKDHMRLTTAKLALACHILSGDKGPLRTINLSFHYDWENVLRELAKPMGVKTEGFGVEGKDCETFKEMRECAPEGYRSLWGNILEYWLWTLPLADTSGPSELVTMPSNVHCAFLDLCGGPTVKNIRSLMHWVNRIDSTFTPTIFVNFNIVGRGWTKQGIIRELAWGQIVKSGVRTIEDSVFFRIREEFKKLDPNFGVKLIQCLQYNGGEKSDMLLFGFQRTHNPTDQLPSSFAQVKLSEVYDEQRPPERRFSLINLKKLSEWDNHKNPNMVAAGYKAWQTRMKNLANKT